MMTKTEKLKHIILSKYNSIREFARIAEIPSTTLTSALDKDIGGMAVDRVIKICEILNVDIKTLEPLEQNHENLFKEETTKSKATNKNMKMNEKIKSRREELGLTLQDIGDFIGVSKATVQRYESGEIKNLKLESTEKLAIILNVSPVYLMGWEKSLPDNDQEYGKETTLLSPDRLNETRKDNFNMINVEESLKELILSKYKSLREFTIKIEMPYSTLDTILKRGVDKANIINILKICNELNISIDKLANGIIESKNSTNSNLSQKETTLLTNFNKLNETGKDEAIKRVEELTEISRYKDFIELDVR